MTIMEAITAVDNQKFNTIGQDQKLAWLSKLDGMVKSQIIDTHEGGEDVPFSGYDDNTDLHTVLLVGSPYDSIYLRWLEAQIDYMNDEIKKYNISITLFNTEYEAFAAWYNRNHMPVSRGRRFAF